jgi:chromosomal replication initiation ATPase DnaA
LESRSTKTAHEAPREVFGFHLFTGEPGSGKTSLMMRLLNSYSAAGWKVIWLSPADTRQPICPHIAVREIDDAERLILSMPEDQYPVLAIDELETFAPSDEQAPEFLRKLVRLRRHVHVSTMGSSQCPWDIHPKVRKLYSRIYYFKMDVQGQDWLKRQGAPAEHLVPPDGRVGIWDKFIGYAEMIYTPSPLEWIGGDNEPT